MAKVLETTTACKPKAFYAQFHGLPGVITRPNQDVLFLEHESGSVVTITQADTPHLVVLGEVGETMAQYIQDMAAGGYAAMACSRRQEVA